MVEKKRSLWDELGDYPKVERHVATPEELAEHWDFVARLRRLRVEMYGVLLEEYPDKYVGLPQSGDLVVADSMEELVSIVHGKGLGKPGTLAWVFLSTKPRVRVIIR